ncbi:hypothetical protein ADJ73_12195 [Arsenicicoccus sp. oral taxon 190]|nr:hypothetical protein ADJ73_12195 [Arsenicicoccus sp. oral taxon 190]
MTLLTEMMQRPLDPGYAAEADRREAAGLSRTPGGRTWRMALVLFAIGLLVAVAAQALRQPKAAVSQQKSALIAQIEHRQAESDRLEARLATWETEIGAARARALTSADQQQLAARVQQAELAAATATVHGPGLEVTVDDARSAGAPSADGNPRTGSDDPGRVQSGDLQLVVNGLWQAGAEAIDINGHRLTSTSAIRFAGEAILVDYRPLPRPYVIHAIGDPASLQSRFLATEGGRSLDQLGRGYGIQHGIAAQQDLTLRGDSTVTLRYAKPVASAIPTPSPTSPPASSPQATTAAPPTTTTEARP